MKIDSDQLSTWTWISWCTE